MLLTGIKFCGMLPQLMGMQIRPVCQRVFWSIQTHKSQKTVFLLCLLDCFIHFGVTGRVHIWAKARSTLGWVVNSSHGPLCEHLRVWCLVQEKQLLTFKNIPNINSAPTHMKGAICNLAWFQQQILVKKGLSTLKKKHQRDRRCTKTEQFTIQPITEKMVCVVAQG